MSLKDNPAVLPEPQEGDELSIELPKLFIDCVNAYNAMLKYSEEEEEDGPVIWTGALTAFLEEEAGISVANYSRVTGALSRMQCIIQLRRGSGKVHSKWGLLGPPTYESYLQQRKRDGYQREKKKSNLKQRLEDLLHLLNIERARLDHLYEELGIEEPELEELEK